ncbi:MAG TPA: HPF/RaiA family ribosome-associated protein [Candidatus Binatia bacterium]|nr:HPF/RaiA family ribosome-associated protein [Candidatus Binatia bacterium]
MQIPLELTFRNVRKDPQIEALIQRQVAKLETICPHMVSCRVSVEKPQEHQRSGNPFRVRIKLTVPPEHELTAVRNAGEGDLHEPLPAVVRRAFQAARQQLKKLVAKQQQRVKIHSDQQVGGFIARLFPDQGYGFIENLEGREIYFHRNSLTGNEFDALEVGTGVRWTEQEGEKGPQASSVHIVDQRSRRR